MAATKTDDKRLAQAALDEYKKNAFGGDGWWQDPATGTIYQVQNAYSGSGEGGGMVDNTAAGFYAYKPRYNDDGSIQMGVGDQFDQYGLDGSFQRSGAFKDAGSGLDLAAMGIGAAVGMGAFLPGAVGAGSAASGAGAGLGGSGAFLGEGVASGVGAWDTALANAGSWTSAGGFVPGLDKGAENLFQQAVTPGAPPGAPSTPSAPSGPGVPPNPYNPQTYLDPKNLGNYLTSANGIKTALGLASAVGGAVGGAKGEKAEKTTTVDMPSHLKGPVVNDLFPRVQGLLNSQLPDTIAQGKSLIQQGQGLLAQPVAKNGFGLLNLASGPAQPKNTVGAAPALKLQAPTTATNPYAGGVLDDLQRRSRNMIDESLLGIQGNAVSSGGLGGSRQGVAQGLAIERGQDNFLGASSSFMSGLYNEDQNRAIQKYGIDANYNLGARGQDVDMYGMNLDSWNTQKARDLSKYQGDQSFYNAQRDLDYKGTALGAGLLAQGQQAPWDTLKNANDIYKGYFGNGSQTASVQGGGGWSGALGGLMNGVGFGAKMGWWS